MASPANPLPEPLPPPAPARWTLAHRIAFRFAFCYLLLYCLPEAGRYSIASAIPGGAVLFQPWTALSHAVCPWVAIHIFHLSGQPTTYFPTGSGDTTLAYIQNLLFVVCALAATLVWSVFDRRRPHYRTLHIWTRLLVRYVLAITLIGYGSVKVAPLQFPPTRLALLMEPFGDFSPMRVLWSFMGASQPYTMFSGAAEVLGGVLLLFRRTTTLGALVSAAVLTNVVALNFCYDVPVKLYSSNLLLIALFLAAPDFRRLLNVFVLNRPEAPADPMRIRFARRRLNTAATISGIVFALYIVAGSGFGAWWAYRSTYLQAKHHPIYGIYDVESFSNGIPARWRKVAIDDRAITARTLDDRAIVYGVSFNTATTVSLNGESLNWTRPDPDHLVLQGPIDGRPTTVRLRKIDLATTNLLGRGFHWINEFPFNR